MSFIKQLEHLKISLEVLRSATNNFSSANLIGRGGFGKVYKGEILLSGVRTMVAIKRLDTSFGQGNPEFWKEILLLSQYKHENLVSLLGFCDEGHENLLVYEYLSKKSLDLYLNSVDLSWHQRLIICLGAAMGLQYLHEPIEGSQQRVLHRDIKSTNILLDHNWRPKIADFGLSKMGPTNQESTFLITNAVGTTGYIDPSYLETGFITKESDVYSFGVVLLEVLCGRSTYIQIYDDSSKFLVPLARKCYEEDKMDTIIHTGLHDHISPKCLQRFSAIAYQCLHSDRAKRPTMGKVVQELRFALNYQTGEFADLQIPLEDIILGTNNFHEENFIGEGTSRECYKGILMQSGKQINVVARRFNALNGKEIEFWTEISMLSSLKHKNIVSIVGFCLEKSEKIIIYDNAVHGSLDQLLSDPTFTWPRRLKVCRGVADALRYIHYDVIHCNLNSSMIFVDKGWEAKVFGFELSTKYPESWMHRLLFSHYFHTSSGYKDPDYLVTKSVIPKYDVYSFGVILFEVLYGRKAIITGDSSVSPSLAKMATDHYKEGNLYKMINPDLRKQMDSRSLKTFSETAYHCLQERVKRPAMDKVFRELEDASELQWEQDIRVNLKLGDEATSSNNLKRENQETMKIPLSKITSAIDFEQDLPVGKGGFALVYKAELHRSDILSLSSMKGMEKNESSKITVALKRILSRADNKGEKGYLTEIELLSRCKHKNIVSLLGYCRKESEMILVYEYAFKGSLGDYLCNHTGQCTNLTWVQRIKICLDIARGLEYLHTDMDGKPRIIHRDIKSDNILLDEEMNAKIADFGLSRFQPKNQETGSIQTQYFAGTRVYADPEFLTTKKYKKESDIYSFGVVLFEMLSGKLAYDQIYLDENENGLGRIARRRFNEGTLKELMDPKIIEEADDHIFTLNRGPNQDSFNTFSKIAYECLAETQAKRPTIEVVIMELQRALKLQGETLVLTRFQLNDIESAIKSSAETNSIGSDASGGIVYKAKLHCVSKSSLLVEEKNNAELEKEPFDVAIKHFSSREDGEGDQQGFFKEIDVLTRCKHGNIVTLLGFCDEGREMILVFEDASNGSIDDYLRKTNNKANLTWAQRLKWCLDIARGLNHLHTKMGGAQGIIHGDIKSANFLIGKNSEAKIAYYGLSKSHQANQVANDTNNSVGTNVYLDPEYDKTGSLNKESDIFSFGVVLLEVFCGRLAYDPKYKEENDRGLAPIARQRFNDGTIKKMIDPKLKEENDEDAFISNKGPNQDSLNKFLYIAQKCLGETPAERPTMRVVILELEIALNFQWFSPSRNGNLGNSNTLLSATNFSYGNRRSHKWRSIQMSTARFDTVTKMADISDLKIQIKLKTSFLTLDAVYGVYLVFKLCDQRQFSGKLMYVNLKYKKGSETLHAYFATPRDDDGWMTIELYRFLKQKEDTDFEVFLESFSRYYCGNGAIYVEGLEFQAIDNMKDEEIEKLKEVQQVPKLANVGLEADDSSWRENMGSFNIWDSLNLGVKKVERLAVQKQTQVPELNVDRLQQLTNNLEETSKISVNDYDGEELALCEVDGKKHLMISAKKVLFVHKKINHFESKPSADSRFQYVMELLPRQVFGIKYEIDSKMLSPFTEYTCYLVFKLSEKCHGLHCPVKVRDLLHRKNKDAKILYFRSPDSWNQHDTTWVPKLRKDGWMEVMVWRFNSKLKLGKDCIPMNLKLISFEGTMSGLIVCGLEFRPT